jgi:DNA repair protein RecN (Recombination protein N)
MLQKLIIQNYALIEQLELPLNQGFSVVTGETGAGKSILLGALALVLGKRADVKALRDPETKCIVEAHFILQKELQPFFEEHDLDFDEHSILRREILPSGKSRAFINDTPVTLDVVNALAFKLIDVHSQHETILLTDTAFQMQLLDAYAKNSTLLEAYSVAYNNYKAIVKQLEALKALAEREGGDTDYLKFLFDELEEARLVPGELEQLEEEFETLSHADEISSKLDNAYALLYTEEEGALQRIQKAMQQFSALLKLKGSFGELYDRLNSMHIELDDVRLEIERSLENSTADPARAEVLSARMSKLFALLKKHQAAHVEELIEKKNTLDDKVAQLSSIEEDQRKLEQQQEEAFKQLAEKAEALHTTRTAAALALSKHICSLLEGLNMRGARIDMRVTQQTKFTALGNDALEFAFSANAGQALQPLSKVASGGELSRVMLAIKAIMAQTKDLPSIIFDEIDTGVSGETAGKIGDILAQMGQRMQVLAITHLPQIAAKGSTHLKVEKQLVQDRTTTNLFVLSALEREQELARLLSGENISDLARQHAREMLQQ